MPRWESDEQVYFAAQVAGKFAEEVGGWGNIQAADPAQMDRYDSQLDVQLVDQQAATVAKE